ncbi:MAG: rhodanese-like domain-containing protein [Rhizobiaceae bacterium]|nr:rhodanese-like domain-containing protein [Rhizobiaceae bacterium]
MSPLSFSAKFPYGNHVSYAKLGLLWVVLAMLLTPAHADTDYNGKASAETVHQLSQSNVIKLIDIRRPSEWRQTGVGRGAHKISMHQDGFVTRIDALVGGDRSQPVALICARGVRSSRMKARLNALGFTNVTNVSEGMLGSKSGPGWLKRKLPLN